MLLINFSVHGDYMAQTILDYSAKGFRDAEELTRAYRLLHIALKYFP
jgi:hypothetical protein